MVFPYLKGFDIIKCGFSILFHGSVVYSIFLVIYFVFSLWYLTIGIRALSLAGIVGKYFYFFCRFIFSEKKKEGRDIPDDLCRFWCKICRNWLYI
jgi:hypothetical protein